MATQTDHMKLTKPAYTDSADIAVINSNMDAIDTATSKILPVISGTTNNSGYTIASGEYFEANGKLYKANASIPTNQAWSSSATEQSDHGAINALNGNLANISGRMSYESLSNVQDADLVNTIKGFLNNGSKGGVFLASRCTNTPDSTKYYKIRFTKLDGSVWIMLEAWNTSDTSLYYISEMNPSTSAIASWKQYALKSDLFPVFGSSIASITTANGSWTATRNCWCSGTLKVAQGSAAIVYYDGYSIAEVNGANDTEITATFPVKQGTVVTTRNVGVYNLKFY